MESYNVKLTRYKNNATVKTYLQPIVTGRKRKVQSNEPERTERTEKQIEHSIRSSMSRTKQAIYGYALSNAFEWFVTFTFNPRIVNSRVYDDCVYSLSNWLNEIRKRRCPDMVYLVVPEYHTDKEKFHFHALMSNISELCFVDSGRLHNDKPVYNLYEWRFGFSTAEAIDQNEEAHAKVCGYMLKYITKDLVSLTANRRRYWISRSTIKKPDEQYFMLDADEMQEIEDKSKDVCGFCKTLDIPVSYNKVKIFNL